ncbi:MAG: SPFH domain-containing protein [Acutalibacteraceae bacterium]|nr:SPFH domain-containing protein [Acutalibacteraceae bacterium]
MGIIKAAINSISGNLGDQYLEAIEPPSSFSGSVVFAPGVKVRANDPRNTNKNGSDNIVNNGSIIQVWPNMMMIIVDGGKITAASCEPGYYKVDNTTAPSLFAGEFKDTLTDAFERWKFGGITPRTQRVYYINTQEILNIKYGTANPINYWDTTYNAEVFIRARGTYSLKIVNPFKFFAEVISKGDALAKETIDFNDIKGHFNGEFLTALEDSLGKMSNDGIPFHQIRGNTKNLTKYLADALDEEWKELRGMEIISTTFTSSYDEKTQQIMSTRLEAMSMADPNAQAGYMAKNVAEGIKAAGSNAGGATNAFLGMGMGMNMGGNIMQGYQQQQNYQPPQQFQQQRGGFQQGGYQQGGFQQGYQQPMQPQQPMQQPAQPQQPAETQAFAGAATSASSDTWTCSCGAENAGRFCQQCGQQKPEPAPQPSADGWVCSCGTQNKGKFCMECGSPMPAPVTKLKCSQCGFEPAEGTTPKFCPECGNKL